MKKPKDFGKTLLKYLKSNGDINYEKLITDEIARTDKKLTIALKEFTKQGIIIGTNY